MQKQITILGRTFEVRQVTRKQMTSIYKKKSGDSGYPDGLLSYDARIIYIRTELPAREKRLTLYHEVVHAALRVSGANMTISQEVEEVICETVANAFSDLIKT